MKKQTNVNEPIKIEAFITSTLTVAGWEKGKDFSVSKGQLFIKKNPLRGKLVSVLKETYPQYNYYWETPKMLRWF